MEFGQRALVGDFCLGITFYVLFRFRLALNCTWHFGREREMVYVGCPMFSILNAGRHRNNSSR